MDHEGVDQLTLGEIQHARAAVAYLLECQRKTLGHLLSAPAHAELGVLDDTMADAQREFAVRAERSTRRTGPVAI